ncbi:MAG: hypothetical protein R3C29_10575 [Dehalococcoidia bacterium]
MNRVTSLGAALVATVLSAGAVGAVAMDQGVLGGDSEGQGDVAESSTRDAVGSDLVSSQFDLPAASADWDDDWDDDDWDDDGHDDDDDWDDDSHDDDDDDHHGDDHDDDDDRDGDDHDDDDHHGDDDRDDDDD